MFRLITVVKTSIICVKFTSHDDEVKSKHIDLAMFEVDNFNHSQFLPDVVPVHVRLHAVVVVPGLVPLPPGVHHGEHLGPGLQLLATRITPEQVNLGQLRVGVILVPTYYDTSETCSFTVPSVNTVAIWET
jgi:hypothetical protein